MRPSKTRHRPVFGVASDIRHGAVTVEFAFCASIFFMIVLGMFEFSRYIFVCHAIESAAYESARLGIVPGATTDQVRTLANRMLATTGVRNASVTTVPVTLNGSTPNVTVNISCRYNDNSWLPPTYLTNRTIVSAVTLDHENQAYLQPSGGASVGNNNSEPVDR